MNNLLLKIIFSFVILLITLVSISSHYLFLILVVALCVAMVLEWNKMTKKQNNFLGVMLASSFGAHIYFLSSGIIWQYQVLCYFVTLWSVDVFSMVGGKVLGGPLLSPSISPKKTWSGLICGITASCLVSYLFCSFSGSKYQLPTLYKRGYCIAILYSCLFAILAQIGDLFVSSYKRRFGVKDSGTLIPGHGGIFDRLDGTILTLPLTVLILLSL